MITIIAQNQRVALTIARAIEADDEASRYYYNDKYFVTWMTGKMVEITTPRGVASYWFRGASFPHIPQYFTLSVTTKNRKDGTSLNETAAAQIATIRMLLKKSDSVISAMEPNGEGELKFRYLMAFLGAELPTRRAVINELTNSAIKYAVTHPVAAGTFDQRYRAQRLRDEADWLVNVNARRAVAFAAGRGTYQVGRTSSSVLSMIAERNLAVRKQQEQQKLHYTTIAVKDGNGNIFPMRSEDVCSVAPKADSTVKIVSVEVVEKKDKSPKLHNMASVQLEAAKEFDMTPLRSYEAAMRLYERKLISFPATTATTVTRRRYEECRKSLAKLLAIKDFASVAMAQPQTLQGRAVDKHPLGLQGIVVTSVPALVLDDDMSKIYFLIVRRMYQAFSKNAVLRVGRIVAECEGVRYSWVGQEYKVKGWHGLFPDTLLRQSPMPSFNNGDETQPFSVGSCTVTTPKIKEYTLATILEELYNERGPAQTNEVAKDLIQLEENAHFSRDIYGNITLTEKGRALYSIVRGMKISTTESVQEVEKLISTRLKDEISTSAYEHKLKQFTNDVTSEILSSASLYPVTEEEIPCPHCATGLMKTFGRVAKCDNPECGRYVFRQFCGVTLDHEQLSKLLKDGATDIIKGFRSFKGNLFKARVIINENGDAQVSSKSKSATR